MLHDEKASSKEAIIGKKKFAFQNWPQMWNKRATPIYASRLWYYHPSPKHNVIQYEGKLHCKHCVWMKLNCWNIPNWTCGSPSAYIILGRSWGGVYFFWASGGGLRVGTGFDTEGGYRGGTVSKKKKILNGPKRPN